MKKAFSFLITLIISCVLIYGKQIDENTAKSIGQNFLIGRSSTALRSNVQFELAYKSGVNIDNILSALPSSTFFYVFNSGPQGFVIVSGDDNAIPILGYSYDHTFDPNNIPQNVAKWLEGYKKEIRYIIENNIKATDEISEAWKNLKSNSSRTSAARLTGIVDPLMQTQWNQDPFYNSLCPGGSVTGCVATAMAQIMRYWSYPTTGSGFHSYNHPQYGTLSANFGSTTYQWSSMPNSLSSTNDAVATLMYQVGVSVDMNYSPEVSGAYVISDQSPVTNCSEYALKTYFGYKNTLQGVQRGNYTQTQWLNLLKTELDASRPILYAGFGSGGGHCFVADGYDNNDYIHFNWGWGGAYDGYFQINALNPSGTGTGGGLGGYNSGHQAVIGIEPPSGAQSYNMALYDYVTPNLSTIYYGQAFNISTNISNNGANVFNGDYCAAVFDNDLNFIDYVEIKTGYSLQGGNAYASNLTFSNSGLFGMLPGDYFVGIFYRPTGGNWIKVATSGSYLNLVPMTVINFSDIELNSSISVTPGSTLTQGQAATVNLNIVNDGSTTFVGQYAVNLYNLDGSLAQAIEIFDESGGLSSGYTYLSPYLTFNTTAITVEPGTYLLAVVHKSNTGDWELTGSSYHLNPIKVTVTAPSILPDIYEINNNIGQAYNLPISFSANTEIENTAGSNCHIGSDYDYYKAILPSGYNYTITPRLHDSYNSGDGNTYSLDGLFSYSTDGSNWSEVYDDVMPGSIMVNNGGTIYFHVAPYFSGETGTYLLDIGITRNQPTGIKETELADLIRVYPNPSIDFVSIDLSEFNGKINSISIINIHGQPVYSETINTTSINLEIPLTNISEGLYFIQLKSDKGLLSKKIVVGE